jgi:hypothetical protein
MATRVSWLSDRMVTRRGLAATTPLHGVAANGPTTDRIMHP